MADEPSLTGDDVEEEKEERKPRRSPGGERSTSTRRPQAEVRLERKLKGGLQQLGAILGRRDERLGKIISEDADKMAIMLSRVAQTGPKPLKGLIALVSELLEPLDAFGRTVSHLVRKVRDARASAREEWEEEDAPDPAEPWRTSE